MDKKKILKSCTRCRKHKTKCDASKRHPLPCSHCSKRDLECSLDIVNAVPNRIDSQIIESLNDEVNSLKLTVDNLITKKNKLINTIIMKNPSISEIQKCIEYPIDEYDEINDNDNDNNDDDFTITYNNKTISISLNDSEMYFMNYKNNYHHFLPIFPDNFFELPINEIFKESELLFWCIILTSSINLNNKLYKRLSKYVKQKVVDTCWFKTPRSVYVLSSLLILTTWPIINNNNRKINDDLSIKYLSLMKNLSLQLGLHRLEFINEFSHKTNLIISKESDLNNLIRERIYKFITINLNYWLINLGLLYLNFNGNQEDYIINKSNNFNFSTLENDDKYINSLLKISLIQQRLNENLNDSDITTKSINLNMFEVILSDFKKNIATINFDEKTDSITNKDFINLSIEFSKVQLFSYSFDKQLNLNLNDYKKNIYKTLNSCFLIVSILQKVNFKLININSLPVHYKFMIEFVSLILLRIYYSPLLNIEDYEKIKTNFSQLYQILKTNIDANYKIIKIIEKFNTLFSKNLLSLMNFNKNYYLINKFNNYQNSNIIYEIIWLIYIFENNKSDDTNLNWQQIGLKDENLINYLDNLDILAF
ncbi:hypothetical protein CLIB1444_10S00826 [[Candida] jaroonii]|uniref:Uncharacterized protein n=1 Tax=[Candida] jaroonii TaxID=467808 RepID=A0ACA9YCH4_9ASCO|nr:hypothetical protein CLIB1444_10S00826 [[Candida] jaroonii]